MRYGYYTRISWSGGKDMARMARVPEWIAVLERRLGHRSAPGKPGPKPRADRETKQEPEE
jgi:hypothetical protein